jgi:hypothetical protein
MRIGLFMAINGKDGSIPRILQTNAQMRDRCTKNHLMNGTSPIIATVKIIDMSPKHLEGDVLIGLLAI